MTDRKRSEFTEKRTEMSEKPTGGVRGLYERYKEVILYLIFGVLTTAVGWGVYFIVMYAGRAIFSIPTDDVTSGRYLALYLAAQIIQWIAAVLFAFFTNRAFVFSEGREGSIPRQLVVFAGGRVVSFGLDVIVTYFGALLLSLAVPALGAVIFIGREWNVNEILAKVVAAVIVIILNYFFSKFLVFRKKRGK